MVQQCETTHTKECTVDYLKECVTEKERKCVMESEKLCETEHITECWEEEQKDCRTKPKCNTVLEEVCSTTYEDVCYKKKKQKRETRDHGDMNIVDPALIVAVDKLQEMKKKEDLHQSDEFSEGGKPGEEVQWLTREGVALNEASEGNVHDIPIIVKGEKSRHSRKKREVDIVQRIIDSPQNLQMKRQTDDQKNIVTGRQKRSLFMDYMRAVNAGYNEDCEEVARDHCVKVPVEKCHEELSCQTKTHEKCEEVPHERCWEEPRQRCWEEPKERCWQEPYERCWEEPHEKCWEAPVENCHEVPREKCEDVIIQVESDYCEPESEKSDLVKPRRKRQSEDDGKIEENVQLFKMLSVKNHGK